MSPRTCPNTKCTYSKQLQSGQRCPLCGKEAEELKFSEFGNLLKKKDKYKKSVEMKKEHEQILSRVKFCPKCGSINITSPNLFLPPLFLRPSIWKCLDCGYEGALIVENSELPKKVQERYWKTRERD